MSSGVGFVVGAAQLGLQAIVVRPKRSIGAFVATVTIEEQHQDDLQITDHPVEIGANITDHAYRRPSSVVIKAGWSNAAPAGNVLQSAANAVTGTVNGAIGIANQVSGALGGPSFSSVTGNQQKSIKEVYQDLLTLQAERTLIDVLTGKRNYKNMLIESIMETTNVDTENSLLLTIKLREVIVVSTRTVELASTSIAANPGQLKQPQKNAVTTNSGTKQLIPSSPLGSGTYGIF